jgi:hypothetical protein
MGTKSRERIYGSSIRAAAEQAAASRQEADRLELPIPLPASTTKEAAN